MKKIIVSLVLILVFVFVLGILFSRWWRSRTAGLVLPKILTTSVPANTTLSTLLSRMRPLTSDEKTIELSPVGSSSASGLIRYRKENGNVQFTLFGMFSGTEGMYRVWSENAAGKQFLGTLREGKGGWLFDGKLPETSLPVTFRIVTLSPEGKDITLLEGKLP